MRPLASAGLIALVAGAIFGQSGNAPKFEIADVHASAKKANAYVRNLPPRNGRYEIKDATMLDLIRLAYGFDPDTVLGGPNWLELDRFDVIAKIPPGTDADTWKAMLQSLLEDRFKLVTKKDKRPVATWVLAAGKEPHLKKADGSGDTGCRIQTASGPPAPGTTRLIRGNPDGTTTMIELGPSGTVQYSCRNMTMAAFAGGLPMMMTGMQLGPEPVLDETGLTGTWNFDVKWSAGIGLQPGSQIPAADAIEKQLGLKLEQKPVPKEVIVVESVNRTPTPNLPGVAEALPSPPPPKEFEVADVKLSAPTTGFPGGMIGMRMQPGGRFVCQNCPLRMLIGQAFNTLMVSDKVAGMPPWVDSVRVDITAKVPPEAPTGPGIDSETLAPMLRSLLVDRFKMTYHQETRPVTVYSLEATKPKMKKADPDSRTSCTFGRAPAGQASQALTCRNATMPLLADWILRLNPGFNAVIDDTGIEGGWDFTLTYSLVAGLRLNAPARGGDGAPDATPAASDPSGGYTMPEAIEKQLGLKLKAEKRPGSVIVIDHLEQKPTDN